ncbi:MAG: ester cyclase [Solirubrobacteraceae bacterium MAG38_C4-C5]|nr:ester cyclase [Candidatus Siliceabacter maunaloa]
MPSPDRDGKELVRRLIDEVLNGGDIPMLEELATPQMARDARHWIEPFLASFSDVHMEIVQLVGECDTVVGRFRCSGTHTGAWADQQPTGRRFEAIDEVYFFTISSGLIAAAWGIEDTLARRRQLGLPTRDAA